MTTASITAIVQSFQQPKVKLELDLFVRSFDLLDLISIYCKSVYKYHFHLSYYLKPNYTLKFTYAFLMEILAPQLQWIGSRCYRVNPTREEASGSVADAFDTEPDTKSSYIEPG